MNQAEHRKPEILDGLLPELEVRDQLGRCPKTLQKYRKEGMPFLRLGRTIYYDPLKVRAWILAKETVRETPRRGRPRKHAI